MSSLLPWELKRGRRLVQVRVQGQLAFGDVYQVLAAALEGFGLAYVPKPMVEEAVKAGRLRYVMEAWHPTFAGLHLYYSSRRLLSPAVALVIGALRQKGRSRSPA